MKRASERARIAIYLRTRASGSHLRDEMDDLDNRQTRANQSAARGRSTLN